MKDDELIDLEEMQKRVNELLKPSEEVLKEVYNQILYIFAKYNLSLSDSFIVSSSIANTIVDEYKKKVKASYIEKEKKEYLLNLYNGTSDEILSRLPNITALNYMTDAIFMQKLIGLDYTINKEVSKSLRKRFQVLKKYGFSCFYCGRRPPEVRLQLEHMHPKSKGGTDNIDNLVPACFECNMGKFNIPLEESKDEQK